ncbi:hypothetical protein [Streptomyces sp. NRRL B-24484]|uniref:hypothetical protein n=1 Tax=Streptomyces sp. NRRL B-24484 TaxID=1463833 RepID=UPI0004C27CD4|nr:hypothetical protein [Streptomyces sp. NRRL B-24484]
MNTVGRPKLGVVAGPVLLLAGLALGAPDLRARVDFAGAPHVRATVLVAAYDRTARGTTARVITVAAPDQVPLADLRSAPHGLHPGDTVTVLSRPGHALLPSQLRWSTLLLPAGLALMGLLLTVLGIQALRSEPPPAAGDPEAWD